jgi:hypothetical protein
MGRKGRKGPKGRKGGEGDGDLSVVGRGAVGTPARTGGGEKYEVRRMKYEV